VPCVLCLRAAQACILVRRPLGALWLAGYIFNPPAWCGAASTALCGGCEDPHPSWRSSSVESGAKVTAMTWQALVASQEESRKRLGGREAILLIECFNNVEYGWLSS